MVALQQVLLQTFLYSLVVESAIKENLAPAILTDAFQPCRLFGTGVKEYATSNMNSNKRCRRCSSRGFSRASFAVTPHLGDAFFSEDKSVDMTEEKASLEKAAKVCTKRNLPLDNVKNARDLASVQNSPIKPNRVYRMGKLSDSSPSDLHLLFNVLGIRTVIDLRSPTELKEDKNLHRDHVFGEFNTIQWKEGKRTKYLFNDGHHKKFGGAVKDRGVNAYISTVKRPKNKQTGLTSDSSMDASSDGSWRSDREHSTRLERHFVSLMNEFKYVRGTLAKFRKRDIAQALLKSPGAILSRRVRREVKDAFLHEINDGGLPMLNELMLRMGASGINYVLDVVADPDRHPVAFHCTAGKDRTGIISAIILSLVGVPDEDIVEDYSLSANVYAEINDHTAMVGALSQRNLNPKIFLGAPPQVMRDTLESIRDTYGSVEGYLEWIGFDKDCQEDLKASLLE